MIVLLSLLVFAGCVPHTTPVSPIPIATSRTLSPSQEPIATPDGVDPTAVPTLMPEHEKRLAEALQFTECVLPCYLGIIPGETTLQDARGILESLGGVYMGPFQRTKTDGAFDYTYQFHIGDMPIGNKIVYGSISLITDGTVVQVIENAGAGTSLTEKEKSWVIYRQYWHRYNSPRQIFLQLGEPEQIYTFRDRSDTLIIFYDNPDIRIDIVGTEQENNLCPRDRLVNYLSIDMTISNIYSPFSINGAGGVPLTDHEIYFPIEETFGVTVHEFYQQIMANPLTCLESKTLNP